ncbi:hypothetical protein C8Q75DRAFT_401496 [Abortiporus biennis]|nr:hypothetical protein C8Q75DRAFT_401496 [Abortiporus biennis]
MQSCEKSSGFIQSKITDLNFKSITRRSGLTLTPVIHFDHSTTAMTVQPLVENSRSSSPQCCHCGYRGAHAENCPFNFRPPSTF